MRWRLSLQCLQGNPNPPNVGTVLWFFDDFAVRDVPPNQ